ncbi:MAG TPA: hypothetical protein VM598_09425 [Bdellovibrionota bacterium]|nr:hypothetical protein [Bdellovibrionota bacterium]
MKSMNVGLMILMATALAATEVRSDVGQQERAATERKTAKRSGGGTSGHGSDVVLCKGYDAFFESTPAAEKPSREEWHRRVNSLDGYYSWDWMQLGRKQLATIPGASAEQYVDRLERLLLSKLPTLGERFVAFRRSIGNERPVADPFGVIRNWFDGEGRLPIREYPPVTRPVPQNCGIVPVFLSPVTYPGPVERAINRIQTGDQFFIYTYDPQIFAALRAQDDPQYSMVLFHEFLRDDRDDNDAAIWRANVLLHSTEVDSLSPSELKLTLIGLGIEAGLTSEDIEDARRNEQIWRETNEKLQAIDAAIDERNIRLDQAYSRGRAAMQVESCALERSFERALRRYLDASASVSPPLTPFESRLATSPGIRAALDAWEQTRLNCRPPVEDPQALLGSMAPPLAEHPLLRSLSRLDTGTPAYSTECASVRSALFDELRLLLRDREKRVNLTVDLFVGYVNACGSLSPDPLDLTLARSLNLMPLPPE